MRIAITLLVLCALFVACLKGPPGRVAMPDERPFSGDIPVKVTHKSTEPTHVEVWVRPSNERETPIPAKAKSADEASKAYLKGATDKSWGLFPTCTRSRQGANARHALLLGHGKYRWIVLQEAAHRRADSEVALLS